MNYIYYFDAGSELARNSLKKMSKYLKNNKHDSITVMNDVCTYKNNIVSIISFTGNIALEKSIQYSLPMCEEYYLKAIRTMFLGFQYESSKLHNVLYIETFKKTKKKYELPKYVPQIRRVRINETVEDYTSSQDGFIWFNEVDLLGADYTFLTYEDALKSFNEYVENCL